MFSTLIELGIRPSPFPFVGPEPVEGLFPKQLDGADGLVAGLAGDLLVELPMDAILANVFGREQLGRAVVKLAQLTDTGVIGLFGPRADGQEFEVIGEEF